MKRLKYILILALLCSLARGNAFAQINTEQVMRIGQNSLYLEDYVLAIQYFNKVIEAKPYLAQPYFYRAIAKISLDDYRGAEDDASTAIRLNPFITNAYEVRGVARQNLGRTKEAIDDYSVALEQLPESRGILLNKALAEEELNDYESAEATYATLLKYYPRYDNGYVGRARLYMEKGDTVAALADVEKALSINKNNTNAYIIRADVAINSERNFENALADMDEAIKLQPQYAGFFVNRAFLRYNLDDYFGAMADYDYAIQLDPINQAALFNRGLLRSEVHDNNKAIDDFTQVLQLDPNNYKALYNRALLYHEIGDYENSINDINKVIATYPSFAGAYFLRCEDYRATGNMRQAERDYNKSLALSKAATASDDSEDSDATPETTQEDVANRFKSLLTIDNNAQVKEEYQTAGIKGRVQDRKIQVEIEPAFTLSYYLLTNEIKRNPYYIKEIDDINATRQLRFIVMVTNREPQISDEEQIAKHFASIEYYNSYLQTHKPRAIDYFGRAMDYYTLHDYAHAIADLGLALEAKPDFAMAYFLRANARIKQMQLDGMQTDGNDSAKGMTIPGFDSQMTKAKMAEIMDDLDKVIELDPRSAFAYYNKGNLLVEAGDLTSALSAYSKAIELKPDLGEAYYNRGYLYMRLGNKDAGVENLSKAGELGIVPSYNLLKRMSR
ncbi:MAG: tetratricopeptide repeat protein [Muribaculum sp.]|nr:tetratricopeptide repeat protein [Muribaculum sp.]